MNMPAITPGSVVPLFPLPDLILFPAVVQTLHIFEPRYRQMMTDALDSSGRIVIGTVLPEDHGKLSGEAAPVQPIAGIGQIEKYDKLPDGRYFVLLAGLGRVQIEEAPSDKMYRQVTVSSFDEEVVEDEQEESYHDRVVEALKKKTADPERIPVDAPLVQLVDLLLLHLRLSPEKLYEIFAMPSVKDRVEEALELVSS